MKRKLLLVSALLCFFLGQLVQVNAQDKIKVVDKSAKKVPVWVSSSQADYIITSAIANDLEVAKNQCLEDVRKQIIRSVAENVKSNTQGQISQEVINSEIVSFLDNFSSSYETQSASVPFLKGISASKIEDFYWEKRLNKNTKATSYLYAIKYPFPSIELKRLVHEFEKRDKEIYQNYLSLKEKLDGVSSLEEIDNAINDLNPIITYFFDDTRKNEAKALQQSYRKLYENITFRTVSDKLGEHKFCLVLDGRTITTSQRMKAKSDGATDIRVEPHGENIVVGYSYAGAAYDMPTDITVNLRIGGKAVPYKFSFMLRKLSLKLSPEKIIYLTAKEKVDSLSTIGNIEIRMNIKSEYNSLYIVRSLTLDVPGLSEPIFIDNLDQTFSKREETLVTTYGGSVVVLGKQDGGRLNMLRGSMEVEVPGEGIETRIDFSLAFRSNW